MPREVPVSDLLSAVDDAATTHMGDGAAFVVLDADAGDLAGADGLARAGDIVADGAPEDGRPVLGPVLTYSRRAARKAVAWYVQPVVDHVNAFNAALVAYLRRTDRRIEQLEAEVARLRGQLERER